MLLICLTLGFGVSQSSLVCQNELLAHGIILENSNNLIAAPNELSTNVWRKGPGISISESESLNFASGMALTTNQVTIAEQGAYLFYDYELTSSLAGKTFLYSVWLGSNHPEGLEILRLNSLSQPSKQEYYRSRIERLTIEPRLYSALFTVPSDATDTKLSVGLNGNGSFDFLMSESSLIELDNTFTVARNIVLDEDLSHIKLESSNKFLIAFDVLVQYPNEKWELIPFRQLASDNNSGVFYLDMRNKPKEIMLLSLIPRLSGVGNFFSNISFIQCSLP